MRKVLHGLLGLGAASIALFAARGALAHDCSAQPADGHACREAIATYDSWCDVNGQWDDLCISECNSEPACTGSTTTPLDTCAGAQDISLGGIFTGNSSSYAHDYGVTATGDCDKADGRDAVYKMKFASSKLVTLSTEGSAFDTVLYVRKATSGDESACGGAQVACKDDGLPGYTSSLTFTAEPGQMYYVFVDGWSSSSYGAYKLRADVTDPAPPSNDTIAGATETAILAAGTSFTGTTSDAAHNYSTSCGSTGSGKDRVYKFTIGSTKSVTIDTSGSSYDTVLQLLDASGNQVSGGCNDDNGSGGTWSRLTKSLSAGTYYVVVDGYGGASGSYKINFSGTDSPPILFVNGHGKHQDDYVSYWGGTGGSSLPGYVQARTSRQVVVHGYDHTIGLSTSANGLANDINATFAGAADGSVYVFAHSAGGLVTRYLMSHADDGVNGPRTLAARKIGRLISDQSPQNGTILADIVKEAGFTSWVGGLMGFDTPMVDDMRTFVMSSHGNCTGTTGPCAKIYTIGADGADKGWMNDISTFLGIPVIGTGHVEDWGLMATGAIGRARQSSFDDSDGFISKASATFVGTTISLSNANHFHGTRCDYRTDLCSAAVNYLQ